LATGSPGLGSILVFSSGQLRCLLQSPIRQSQDLPIIDKKCHKLYGDD
jgi:hypothetical protein